MRNNFVLVLVLSLLLSLTSVVWAKRVPVGMVMEPKGTVEYTKKGKKWKKVRRNKFMYENYIIRTGADGTAKFINQDTNQTTAIPSNTEVKISLMGLEAQSGSLGESQKAGDLLAGMGKKFVKTQKYTTVRRSAKKDTLSLKLGRNVVTQGFSEIAWGNTGSQYSYRLHVGLKDRKKKEWKDVSLYEVPSSSDSVVRVKVDPLKKNMRYFVEVLENGEVVYASKDTDLKRLSAKKLKNFEIELTKVRKVDGEGFLYANLLAQYGLLVPAMDAYEQFFADNAGDEDLNDLRPFMMEVYTRLHLEQKQKN